MSLQGAIILDWQSNPFILSIINGIIGAVFGVIITSIVSYIIAIKSLKAERKYYIELEVIPKKILNPLFMQYHKINKRIKENSQELISSEIFDQIDKIFEVNTCWYFVTNKNIKPIIVKIRNYSRDKDGSNLQKELGKLYNLIEASFIKKYN